MSYNVYNCYQNLHGVVISFQVVIPVIYNDIETIQLYIWRRPVCCISKVFAQVHETILY